MKDIKRATIPIDHDKLYAAARRRNMVLSRMSTDMGYSDGYLSKCSTLGRIDKKTQLLLESIFEIKYEEIKPDEKRTTEAPEKPQEQPLEGKPEFTPNELYNIIYRAVYDAVSRAWNEPARPTKEDDHAGVV